MQAVLGALLFASLAASAVPAEAGKKKDKKAEAVEHFKKAVEHVVADDFEAAAGEFLAAYRIKPHYKVLFNIAVCYQHLGDREKALKYYERFVKEGADVIPEWQLAEVRALIELLAKDEALLTVICHPVGATVLLDGKVIGQAPIEAKKVASGPHDIEVRSEGYGSVVEHIEPKAGDTMNKIIMLDENK